MIRFYTWPTPNGQKVAIMLEETGLSYRAIPVNIGKGEQFDPEFLRISPNNKIPAIVDEEGPEGKPYAVFESGAILMYLAEKTGLYLPKEASAKYEVIQWLFFQMASIGPMFGQAGHFINYAPEPIPYAIERYTQEVLRLLGVLEKRLERRDYLADNYSIADMAAFPWVRIADHLGVSREFPNVSRWVRSLEAREGVKRGLELLKEYRNPGPLDEEARRHLFGQSQSPKY
jgi:GST-like protein